MTNKTPPYHVTCNKCDWARKFPGRLTVPTVPHALHFLETGHDNITAGLGGPEATPEINEEEWQAAVMFSAGVTYGTLHVGRSIKARVLAALPDEEHLAPERAREMRALEEVEAYKREVAAGGG